MSHNTAGRTLTCGIFVSQIIMMVGHIFRVENGLVTRFDIRGTQAQFRSLEWADLRGVSRKSRPRSLRRRQV